MKTIERMQSNLLTIRKSVGWSAKEFGDMIGVTRQTINNIESGRSKLTKTQYIAMRSVLDAEIANHSEDTKILQAVLEIIVDHPEKYTETDKEEIINKVDLFAPSIQSSPEARKAVSKEITFILSSASIISAGALAVITSKPHVMQALAKTAVPGWLAREIYKKLK